MATAQIGHIKPFEIESDDWELYDEQLDQFMLANGIDDKKSRCSSPSSDRKCMPCYET